MSTANLQIITVLAEILAPHLASQEGQVVFDGQARLEAFRAALSESSSAAAEAFRTLMLQFMWQQVSVPDLQSQLRVLVSAHQQHLAQLNFYPTKIAPFLDLEIHGAEDEMKARGMLCHAFGLVTQAGDAGAQTIMEKGTRLVEDVEERWRSQPERYDRFLRTVLDGWREGESEPRTRNEVRRRAMAMLEGEKDLLDRAREIWPLQGEGERSIS